MVVAVSVNDLLPASLCTRACMPYPSSIAASTVPVPPLQIPKPQQDMHHLVLNSGSMTSILPHIAKMDGIRLLQPILLQNSPSIVIR